MARKVAGSGAAFKRAIHPPKLWISVWEKLRQIHQTPLLRAVQRIARIQGRNVKVLISLNLIVKFKS
jgi:hypothetical protein